MIKSSLNSFEQCIYVAHIFCEMTGGLIISAAYSMLHSGHNSLKKQFVSYNWPKPTWLHIGHLWFIPCCYWDYKRYPWSGPHAIRDIIEHTNKHPPTQALTHTRDPRASSGLQSDGVFGCTGRRWQHSSIHPAPPIGCWSISIAPPRLKLQAHFISIN